MSSTLTYTSAGVPVRAEYFPAKGKAKRGGSVVIAHGSDGVTDDLNGPWAAMMRDYAGALSRAGFAALLPYYLERTGTPPGASTMQTIPVHAPAWQEALGDALGFAQTLPGAAAGRVALIGFSLGGHLSLRLRGRVRVLVEFFAPFLTGLGSATAATAAHIQIHHGAADQLVDIANAEEVETVLQGEGAAPEFHRYEAAGHGFAGSGAGDRDARRLSRERTLRFVTAHL